MFSFFKKKQQKQKRYKKYQKDKPDIKMGQFDNKTKTKEMLLSLRYINFVFKIYM